MTLKWTKNTEFRESKIHIKDYEISYQIHGNGSTNVTMVQGLMTSMYSYDDLLQHFDTNTYRILLVDNRGVGKSTRGSKSTEWSIETMARDIVEIWDKEKFTKSHLIGISMGGMISLHMMLLFPSRVKSCLLLCACAKPIIPQHYPAGKRLQAFTSNPVDYDAILELLFHDKTWLGSKDPRYPEFKNNAERMIHNYEAQISNNQKGMMKTFISQSKAIGRHDLVNQLPDISARVGRENIVIVTGLQDNLLDPECSRILEAGLKCKAVYLSGKGHGLISESEKEIVPYMFELIDRNRMLAKI